MQIFLQFQPKKKSTMGKWNREISIEKLFKNCLFSSSLHRYNHSNKLISVSLVPTWLCRLEQKNQEQIWSPQNICREMQSLQAILHVQQLAMRQYISIYIHLFGDDGEECCGGVTTFHIYLHMWECVLKQNGYVCMQIDCEPDKRRCFFELLTVSFPKNSTT